MVVWGYGEDGLTYHALTTRLSELLHILGEPKESAEDAVAFFRPSLGRSRIGEFDAILRTTTTVF